MTAAVDAAESAISEAEKLRKVLNKGRPRVQVTLADERSLAKATALAWFTSHKPQVTPVAPERVLAPIDELYRSVLEFSERAAMRTKYLGLLKTLRRELISLRSECITGVVPRAPTINQTPDFAPLIGDPAMQAILASRWAECVKCVDSNVPLAATVMMGGLLEGILLARVNREPDKQAVFTAKSAPKDHVKNPKPLSEWMLRDLIQVAHEVGWLTVSAKDVSDVLRDYRNFIHPQKQLSHNLHLTPDDASLLWEISKNIARQIIAGT